MRQKRPRPCTFCPPKIDEKALALRADEKKTAVKERSPKPDPQRSPGTSPPKHDGLRSLEAQCLLHEMPEHAGC